MTLRCDYSDLPADQCAHCLGVDGLDEKPIRIEGTDREARFAGSCAHCGSRVGEGHLIVLADLYGDGRRDEWCLLEHTRSPGGRA